MIQYKYLKRVAVFLVFPILICTLADCSGKRNGADDAEIEKGQNQERKLGRNSEQDSDGLKIQPEKIEVEYREFSAEYPIITETNAGSVDHVMESEGIYCVYADRRYGFLTENGEEITANGTVGGIKKSGIIFPISLIFSLICALISL